MPYKNLIVLTILLAVAGQTLASRGDPKTTTNNNGEMKQPEWLFKSDPGVLIPGIGRMLVPPAFTHPHHHHPYFGYTVGGGGTSGSGTGSGTGTGTGSDIPGGDDTFVPNPGNEDSTPGSENGGGVPTAARP